MKSSTVLDSSPVEQFLDEYLDSGYRLTPVSGGLVHHVFKVVSGKTTYYLKARGTRFAKMPTVECDPEDIEYEYRALKRLHAIAPKSFPEVIAYDRHQSMMLLSSIMTPDINLEFLLNTATVSEDAIKKIACLVAKVHSELYDDSSLIRGEDEQEYYANNLYYRLSSLGREPLKKVVDRLKEQRRQIVFGDLSPKNMAIDEESVYVCDLDAAHYGNILFDVGFFAGHLLLHTFSSPQSHIAEAFLKAYLNNADIYFTEDDEDLLVRIMIGICIYRLDNTIVPYNLPNLSDDERKEILAELDAYLERPTLKVKHIGNLKV